MKPRIAITIIYDGLHHLQHKGFTDFMVSNFDLWVVVEGQCRNGGSTHWCKNMNLPHRSQDGTIAYLEQIARDHKNVLVYSHHKHYLSKDEMVNKAIMIAKTRYQTGWLWQVDADEHWNVEDLRKAERIMWRSNLNAACFQFNHFIKLYDDSAIIAQGDWGSDYVTRLWRWSGQLFASHEPAVLQGQTRLHVLPFKFDHYSMVFEKDVNLKSRFYKGHEPIYMNWKKLDSYQKFPLHISALFGNNTTIGKGNTFLHKISLPCADVKNQENLVSNHAERKDIKSDYRSGSSDLQKVKAAVR